MKKIPSYPRVSYTLVHFPHHHHHPISHHNFSPFSSPFPTNFFKNLLFPPPSFFSFPISSSFHTRRSRSPSPLKHEYMLAFSSKPIASNPRALCFSCDGLPKSASAWLYGKMPEALRLWTRSWERRRWGVMSAYVLSISSGSCCVS